MIRVVHINDKISNSGGVEVYLSQLQPLLNDNCWHTSWVSVQREGQHVSVVDAASPEKKRSGKLSNIGPLLRDKQRTYQSDERCDQPVIYHVHSISDPVLMEALFSEGPVVRTMHEPRLFCPGHGKFWRASEEVCRVSCGLHCVWHAYQKQCCNRHPKRLLVALKNTQYEITTAAKKYSAIVSNSRWMSDQAVSAGFPAEKIETIHYFTEKKAALPIPRNDVPHILFIGRLTKEKGLHYLLSSLGILNSRGIHAHLNIVGDGHERSLFEAQVSQLGIRDCCTFHGWLGREDIQNQLRAATVVAFPSIYPEAFGIVGIEAMMHARPVVAFDSGGVKDWLSDGINGLLVTSKDTEGLSTALADLCADYERASQLGNAGREIALSRFLPEHHFSALTDLYRKTIA